MHVKLACLGVSQIFRALADVRWTGRAKEQWVEAASPFVGPGFQAGSGEEIQGEKSQWEERVSHKEHAEAVFLRTSGFWDV